MMPFGLTNAHIVFQYLMNDVFCEYLDDFVICYVDDILIFSNNKDNHEQHVNIFWTSSSSWTKYANLKKM
jgi:hypothetical protein